MSLKNNETRHDILNPNDSIETISLRLPVERWFHPVPPLSSRFWETLFRLAVLGLALLSMASFARACGPDFPNNLLDSGDNALLVAPVAEFERELQRLNLAPGRFDHVSATNGYEQQAFDAEMSDLAAALMKSKTSGEESARVVEGHRVNRKKLAGFLDAIETWEAKRWMDATDAEVGSRGPRPLMPDFGEVPGLPVEFSDYFAGVVAFRNADGDDVEARKPWEQLLARPAGERKFRSTWAAFMLGKSWESKDDDKAVEYFQMTRELARRGFVDSIGLAVAATGLEARVELRREHFKRAIELYLEQYAAGDGSAVVSLQWTAAVALGAGGAELVSLSASENTRSVVTAYLICGERNRRYGDAGLPSANYIADWLNAVEAQEVRDVDSSERLALAAYQAGDYESAQRWINQARNTPVGQWLQAKLFLRAGKISQAAALLANVVTLLPVTAVSGTNETTGFADSLHVTSGSDAWTPACKQALGELGVLQLGRREFTQALDALLNAGFWQDAAYVAERVLTTDELKSYVDRKWPPKESSPAELLKEEVSDALSETLSRREDIRHLLARRLTRELRSSEAREYYPANWRPQFDELVATLNEGWNESALGEQRAKALFASAIIARTNGMELLGTELAPDWFINGGGFDYGLTWESRSNSSVASGFNVASTAELRRAVQHGADPEARFHYRYQAAFLAWEAARLMPDNTDETARVLCTAGTWLKVRDPVTADIFYKALVRRCRRTAIGEQADRMRWFPVLDESGNPKPYGPPAEQNSGPGNWEEPVVDTGQQPESGADIMEARNDASGLSD